jgi:hypothetical protein
MENGKRRLIPDPETFNTMRLYWNAIQHIADTDLNNIAEGAPLPSISANHHILTYQELVNSWRNWSDYTTRNPFPEPGKNCTWYAYGRMLQLGYSKAALDTMRGHAGTWEWCDCFNDTSSSLYCCMGNRSSRWSWSCCCG